MSQDEQFPPGGAFDIYAGVTGPGSRADEQFVGRELGDYRVTGLIARGGMGRIFRAERVDGSFEREVAIKVSPGSALSPELKERFLREQAILAGLNHPNICQLFDAGITDEGWPYIVMEMVEGQTIDDYCRTGSLAPNEIVALMTQVVDAIAFAHARLVVHRDLKPSNVMVTPDGRPKLLDFGIAKLLEPGADETGVRPMTPRYASPEQLLGQEVTIASDIYQLGALLAELLAGQPLQAEESIEGAIQRAASGRSLTIPAVPGRALPRELELIAGQCLRSEPGSRYADANALKSDLERFLGGLPVTAAGITVGYRLRKFLQRNAHAIYGSAGAAIVLAAGIQLAVWLATSNPCAVPRERLAGVWDDRARSAVSRSFLATGLSYAPALADRVTDALDRYAGDWADMHVEACEAHRVLGTQSDEMFDKRMMCLEDRLTMLGAVSRRFGQADAATLDSAPQALESLDRLTQCADLQYLSATVGPPPAPLEQTVARLKAQTAEVRVDYATSHIAEASSRIADIRAAAAATGYAPLIAEAELLAGQILSSESEASAVDAFTAAIESATAARDDYRAAESWIEFVFALAETLGDPEAARNYLLSAKTALLRLGDDRALRMRLLNTEGALAFRAGDYRLARDRFVDALAIAEEAGFARAAMVRLNLATANRLIGEYSRARELARASLTELTEREGPDSPLTMRALETLAEVETELGNYETSSEHLQHIVDVFTANLGPRHQKTGSTKRELAWALKELGRLDEANELMQDALDILTELESPPDWALAGLYNDLGDLAMYRGDFAAAEEHLLASIAIWGKDPDNAWVSHPLTNLGFLYNRSGRYRESINLCTRALALVRETRGEDNPEAAYELSCLGEALLGLERPAEAIEPLRKSVELRESRQSYELGWSRFLLARALMLAGQREAGEKELDEALAVLAEHPPPDPHMAATVDPWLRGAAD